MSLAIGKNYRVSHKTCRMLLKKSDQCQERLIGAKMVQAGRLGEVECGWGILDEVG